MSCWKQKSRAIPFAMVEVKNLESVRYTGAMYDVEASNFAGDEMSCFVLFFFFRLLDDDILIL